MAITIFLYMIESKHANYRVGELLSHFPEISLKFFVVQLHFGIRLFTDKSFVTFFFQTMCDLKFAPVCKSLSMSYVRFFPPS